jgi:hypothetical protein
MKNTFSANTATSAAFSTSIEERRSFVESQYEHLWQGIHEKLEMILNLGEQDLSRVHLFMRRNFGPNFEDEHLRKKYEDHEKKLIKTGFILDRQVVKIHDMDPRIATLITDSAKMREAITSFGPSVKRIIELGAGWGKNLFNLFKFGASLDAEYWGLELTATGRKIMEEVGGKVAPTMKVRGAPFDYYHPDFSQFSEAADTCVFTHHSIEQIPKVPLELIDKILGIPGFKICVHYEPCGFQIPSNNWLESQDKEQMLEIDAANRRFAEKRNQNSNLYPLLKGLEQEGKIKIHSVRKYFTSHLINNATTLITWGPPDTAEAPGTHLRDDL